MTLFQNQLDDPTQNFATDSDAAQRLAATQQMFQRIGLMKRPTEGIKAPTAPPSVLDSYRLSGGLPKAFDQSGMRGRPGPGRTRSAPPQMQAPELGRNQVADDTQAGNEQALASLTDSLAPKHGKYDDAVASALAKAEATMKSLGQPGFFNQPRGSSAVASYRPQAMTPQEGPDTGAYNPNASGAGVPAGYFAHLSGAESTDRPGAVNPTTHATGLYQFLPSTWEGIRKEAPHLGLTSAGITDPKQQDAAVRYYTDKSMNLLTHQLGRQPTMGELYALHFLGHAGGMNLIQNINDPVAKTVSAAAISANPWLNSYTKQPGYALLNRLETMMGGTPATQDADS